MALLPTRLSTAGRHARRSFYQRVQAAALSVALVLSAVLPAGVAGAQELDQEQEGITAPEQTAPPDSTTDPDFDPGGETALPFDVGPPGEGGDDDSGDGTPVDTEPVADPDAPPVLLDAPPDALDGTDEPAPPAEVAPPARPVLPPAPAPAPPPTSTTPQADVDQPTTPDRPAPDRTKRKANRKRQPDRRRERPAVRVTIPAAAPVPAPAPAPEPAPPPAPVATTAAEPVAATPPTERSAGARRGQRTHTVQRGESLWTIASDLLGADAANADIAAESNRLYRLNSDRIGTDPNLLIAGTVLRLR